MRSLWFLVFLAACSRSSSSKQSDAAMSPSDGAASDLARGGDGSTSGDASSSSDASMSAVFPMGTICNDSGTPRTAPAQLKHLIVVLYENKNLSSVNGNSNAPYISSLATACGYSTNYADNCFSDNLDSLPHYLALTSGSNCNVGNDSGDPSCIRDDSDPTSHTLTTQSIFSQVSSWKAYEESMTTNCQVASNSPYATKHNPPPYYSALSSCGANDVPISTITCSSSTKMKACSTPDNALTQDLANDTLPALAFVTPDLNNDMHDGTVTQADNWTYTYVPLILASPAYLRGEVAVLLLWDEQSSFSSGGATPNVFISPYVTKGTVSNTLINHFSVLRAIENALGISTYLGCASGTAPGGGSCPNGSTADARQALGF